MDGISLLLQIGVHGLRNLHDLLNESVSLVNAV